MRWMTIVVALLAGCTGPTPERDVAVDAGPSDLRAVDDVEGEGDQRTSDSGADVPDMPPRAPYELLPTQPSTTMLDEVRGRRPVRGLIHAHSVHSHDACDGEPELEDGSPNEACLDDFRRAICATKQDYVFLTEHEELAAFRPFEDLFLQRDGDQLLTEDGRSAANQIACPDGHRPLLLPGGEFGTMPIGLTGHEGAPGEELASQYGAATPEQVQAFRDQGAVVLQAHAESRDRDDLRRLGLDGFEVYQLHANVDPELRADYLGLDPVGFLTAAGPFLNGTGGASDLVFLAFVEPNPPALSHFDALVAEGQELVGTAGTDCHQNAIALKMEDGERVDSYRRMMRWFSNWMLVDDLSRDSLTDALRSGRLWFVFEIFGTPTGFEFRAEAAGDVAEMGDTVSLADQPELVVTRPDVLGYGPVESTQQILRIEEEGAVEVASGAGDVRYQPQEPGAFRAVVRIVPTHLEPHLEGDQKPMAQKEYEWIWANPIYVQ